jgi:chromosome segregation ATPase
MNNQRRKEIAAVRARLEAAQQAVDELVGELESIRDDEQSYFDDMPENFQSGEKGERAQAAIDALEEAIAEVENIDFDAIYGQLDAAVEA